MIRSSKAGSSGPGGEGLKRPAPSAGSSSTTKLARSSSPPPRLCAYSARACSQPVLEKYEYCLRHILEDKNAPFKPCGYAYPSNNKRCLLPAPRSDKRDAGLLKNLFPTEEVVEAPKKSEAGDTSKKKSRPKRQRYCPIHVWTSHMKRQGLNAKHTLPTTPESLLAGLSHYVRPMRSSKNETEDLHSSARSKPINPFVEVDFAKVAQNRNQVLECASDSDSDNEMATMDSVWNAINEDSSDAESVESQMDDSLKHAGIYTLDELYATHHKKLMRLQLMYQRQFERLAHVLKERRRKYLVALKKEKETLCSIADQSKSTAKDQKLYNKLKALNHYHRRSAAESVAYLSQIEKRQKDLAKPPSYTKCFYSEGGVRCSKSTIPLTRYCYKHILEDQNQFLFRACGCEAADTICQDTVTGLCSGETCILHVKLPSLHHANNATDNENDASDH